MTTMVAEAGLLFAKYGHILGEELCFMNQLKRGPMDP
jgi:hypothetical protein